MDVLKKLWPFSFKSKETNNFVITLIAYVVTGIVSGVVLGLMSNIPFIGWTFTILNSLASLYLTAGLVFSILYFTGVFKD